MAEPISIQQLKDASEDAITLADFIYKPANVMIPRRLAADINSLQYYLDYMSSYAQHSYETYDEMVANANNLSKNVSVFVANDLDTSKNGIYTYNGTSFVKGEYQPENAAKEFVEAKLGGLQVFDGKVRAQDVSTVDGSTQESKNTEFRSELDALPFEEGLLPATKTTYLSSAVGAVLRSAYDKLSDSVSVKDFGAIGDATVDDAPAIQAAFDYAEQNKVTIYVPNGTYRVDDTVKIDGGGTVEFAQNATLQRLSQHSDKTTPVFSLRGSHTYSVGGRFETENASPNGVITLGHTSLEDRRVACWWRCIRPYVRGVKAEGNIGIYIPSGQATQGDATANYFGYIDNPVVRYCDDGIVFTEVSNAHTVISPQFHFCMTSAITMYGSYANNIIGGFLHKSDDGIIGVRLKDSRFDGMSHHSWWNTINGFGVEPGGTSSKPFEIDAGSTRNSLNLIGNVAGSPIIHGNRWDNDFDTGYAKSHPKQTLTTVDVTGADGSPSEFLFDKYYTAAIPTSVEGATHIVAESTVSNSTGGMYEVVVHGHAPTLGKHTPSRYIIAFNKFGADPVEVEIVESNVSTKAAATLQVAPSTDGSKLIWTVKFANNGTGTKVYRGGLQIRQMRHAGDEFKRGTQILGDINILPEYKYGSVT